MIIENGIIEKKVDDTSRLVLTTGKEKKVFELKIRENELLQHGQNASLFRGKFF